MKCLTETDAPLDVRPPAMREIPMDITELYILAEHRGVRRHGALCDDGQSGHAPERVFARVVRVVVFGLAQRGHHNWLLRGGDTGQGFSP